MNYKLIVLAAAACGLAAQNPSSRITAKVPFGFEAGGVKLEAGTYTVLAADGRPIVTVVNQSTGNRIMLLALGAGGNREGVNSLEFKRYNNVYFLTAMNAASTGQRVKLVFSKREREMAIAIRPELIVARAE